MIRAQTLEEWFAQYQLGALSRGHFFLPYDMEVDVTRIAERYASVGQRAPMTALVIKAAALAARKHPEVNRAVLSTPLGTRVVQFEEVHVNLPVQLVYHDREHLSATVLRNADRLTMPEIMAEIQRAKSLRLEDLPIGRRFIKNESTLRHRLALRVRHHLAYSVPALYQRFGGGISVSSLVRKAPQGVVVRVPSFGPTALSLCPGAVRSEHGRSTLYMGVGYDHFALTGKQATRALESLGELLVTAERSEFGPVQTVERDAELR